MNRKILTTEQIEKLKEKEQKLFWGLENGKVYPYPNALFNRLRPYSIGGLPATIMLFVTDLCNGYCYDRAKLMSLAFDKCKVVWAEIESLRITSGAGKIAEHAFVETTEFGGGKTWVVDTSTSLIYDKEFYYEMEKPKVNLVFTKKQLMNNPEIKSILASDFEKDKYALALTLPIIEERIKTSKYLGTSLYREKVLSELESFKTAIGYDKLSQEVEEDMKLMYTNPNKLDEKFNIVRDEYGREISRSGVVNPYYKNYEKVKPEDEYFHKIKGDNKKLKEYEQKIIKESCIRIKAEEDEVSRLAKLKLKQIHKNPGVDFYKLIGYGTESQVVKKTDSVLD